MLAVLALCVLAHGLVLALLAIEIPVIRTGPEAPPERFAVPIFLQPLPFISPPKPKPPKRKPKEEEPAPAPAPIPPPPAPPLLAQGELPNLARPVFKVWPRPLPGGTDWTRGNWFGCDDPAAHHLSAEAREKCKQRWRPPSEAGTEIAALIPKDKQAAFDRTAHCSKVYDQAGVPIGTAETARETMGYIPSLRECGPGDH
jgi:hypothetical protein